MGIFRVMQSVLAAAFGVQSSEKRERDFTTGKYMPFIAGGVIFTLLFILTIWGVVQYILRSA